MTTNYPSVQVVEITENTDTVPANDRRVSLDLGGKHDLRSAVTEAQIAAIMQSTRRLGRRVFELTWEGNGVPLGAEILGRKICWTQHGRAWVFPERDSEDDEEIGSYKRVEDYGGPTGKMQKMIVYVTSPKMLDAHCEKI